MKSSLIGVVLCGGASSRMRKDKGLIKTGAITWAERAFINLKSILNEVYISIKESQSELYRKKFPGDILIEDHIELKGPLAGLFSIHKSKPDKDILILACDMQKMDRNTLIKLCSVYYAQKDLYDFFVYKNKLNIEPLAGIYTSRGIMANYNSFFAGKLYKSGLKHLLESGNTYAIKIRKQDSFSNFNTPEDIK